MDLIREIKGMTDISDFRNSILLSAAEIAPDPLKKLWWRFNGFKYKPATSYQIINSEFAQNINDNVFNKVSDVDNSLSYARRSHYEGLNSPSIQYVFEAFDKLAAVSQIELRYPFYDKRLIEYALALPTEQKRHNGWTRWIMRRAMEDTLPPKIQWRKFKGNLGYNFDRSMKLEEDTIELLLKNPNFIKKYIDIDEFNKIYTQCRKVNYSNQYTVEKTLTYKIYCNAYNLWKIITLGQWLKKIG